MKVSYVEWPAGLLADSPAWEAIAAQVRLAAPDVLVTNEMPFGAWLANSPRFNHEAAARSVAQHARGIEALQALGVPLVLSSRPVPSGERLANEAFALDAGRYQALHHKHYFPSEEGWHEADWFQVGQPGFELATLGGLRVGVLLCTELMFNERARAYGRAGADLIIAPRATGTSVASWQTAGAMAALVSGSYVVSSNRVGAEPDGPLFGGHGLAFAPGGAPIGATDAGQALQSFKLDLAMAAAQKSAYPCYVDEGR